jgi:hypothetical protein
MKLTDAMNPVSKDDSFEFFMPVEAISKSEGKDGKRLIQGIASTDDRDLQGEVVKQGGIDYSYFLKHGYINDDHKDGPENKVGEPTECRLTPGGLWIKAYLYKGKERADYWWDHITALATNESRRKVGFSIQGKILRRDGMTILKCWLQDVAITASPVNTSTWAEIVKSLTGQKWCIHPWDPVCKGGCCVCPSHKSLNSDDDAEENEKALSAGGMGRIVTPQSLEGSAKVQTFKSTERISYPEAIRTIQMSKGYSYPTAKALADAIFAAHGVH